MTIVAGSSAAPRGMRLGWGLWALVAIFCLGNAIYAYRYLPGIGLLASSVMANAFAKPFLDIHIVGAATALLVGSVQFLPVVRRRWPGVHRWTGRVYTAGCLIGGIGGLVMAIGSTAGPAASVGFGLLAVLWFATTVLGWSRARQRRFADHRAWMIRSWSLALAAVTLRIYLPLALMSGLPALPSYRAISFLCWVPNLLAAELYLRAARGLGRV